jgi:hypothetical protein
MNHHPQGVAIRRNANTHDGDHGGGDQEPAAQGLTPAPRRIYRLGGDRRGIGADSGQIRHG